VELYKNNKLMESSNCITSYHQEWLQQFCGGEKRAVK